jgi:hypothetical protein
LGTNQCNTIRTNPILFNIYTISIKIAEKTPNSPKTLLDLKNAVLDSSTTDEAFVLAVVEFENPQLLRAPAGEADQEDAEALLPALKPAPRVTVVELVIELRETSINARKIARPDKEIANYGQLPRCHIRASVFDADGVATDLV